MLVVCGGGGHFNANREANIRYGLRAALEGAPLQLFACEVRGGAAPKGTDRRFAHGGNNSVRNRCPGPEDSQGLPPHLADVSKVGTLLFLAIRLLIGERRPHVVAD